MKIVWEFLTSDEIKRRAVCMVEHDIRGGLLSEEDSKGTLADRRMGPALRTETCQTCFKKYDYCEGHFGAIPLAVPIIPFFLINEVKKRIKKPEGCNKISYNKDNGFLLTFKDKTEKYVSANDLLHPGNGIQTTSSLDRFIFSYLLVVPLCIRPYLKYNNGADVAAHPLTTLYKRIVVANNALRDSLHLPAFVVKNKTIALMDAVNCLFDSSKAASSETTTTPYQGIKQLLSSKTGIIRLSVMGARVNFTARTVITADPTLKINQIGLPIHFSEVLTIPVVVTEANIQQIKSTTRLEEEYVRYVSKDQKQQYLLQYTPRDKLVQFLLQVGGTLHRKIKNGDCVVVNRQPSLHKASMMSFYVVLMKDMTLRLPMSVCKAFNADFDGDEMNIHVPQTIQARAEALTLLSVDENLISAQTGMPLIGLIYDALFGIYEMSADHVRVSRELLGDIYCWLESEEEEDDDDEEPIPKKKVNTTTTGKQVLSLAFPRDFDYEKENDVSIRCGILIKGRLCKSNISLILYALYIRYDARTVRGFLNKIQFIVNAWLTTQGFSASIMDGQPSRLAPFRRVVDEVAFQALQTETERLAFLNKIQDVPLPSPPVANDTNGFLRIITAGSKGTSSNYNQMVHCVGQQMLSGQRLLKQSLSHVIEPNTALGGGFVSSSFFQGLNPLESFLHAMAGRQGIVNTCITTAVSGYLTRKFVKTLENVRVLYDGTVRKSNHQIIQFKYSGDGLKPEYVKSFSKMGMEMIKQKATQEECTYTLPSEQRTTMEELIRSHYENEWFRDVLQQHGGETLEFFSHFQQHLQRALIEPGTNVGVIAAQSISEPTTQMTLNSFHFASSAVKGGLPQLIELTHLSEKQTLLLFERKNTPNVPLIEPFEELFEFFVFSRAQKPAWETWEWCYLGSFLPFETVMEQRPSVWVELRQKKYIEDTLFVPIVCALRKLLQQEGGDGGLITHSNYREELFEVRVYCETYDAALSMIKKIKRAKVTATEEAIHAKRVGVSSFELLGNDWENVASFRKMLASFPETVTNSPILMLHTFGVEATCEFMAKQMEDIVGKSADVLYRHFELLVDTMCYSGVPVSIKTTEQDDVSPISKASFEKVLSAFVEGALNNHVDCVETVASKVAIGSRLDADLMDVFLDYEKNEQAMQQLKKDQATRVLLEREEQEYLNMQQIIDFL